MSSQTFGALIEVESSQPKVEEQAIPAAPKNILPRVYHSVPYPADAFELDNLQRGKRNGSPSDPGATPPTGTQSPRLPNDPEMSRPPSPAHEFEVEAMQSFSSPPMNRYRMLSVCMIQLQNGLNDAAPGALIPYMETHYNIGYAIVSLIFVTNAAGFILAAFFVDAIRARIGRAKTSMIAQALITCGYIAIVCSPPFPVIVAAFFCLGLGMAITLAMGQVFVANLQNGTGLLGVMHGSYGVGGTVGPLIATAMISPGILVWTRFYLLPLGLAVVNLAMAGWAFWNYEAETGQPLRMPLAPVAPTGQDTSVPQAKRPSQFASLFKALKSKTVVLGAIFIFAYQGAEVSISGWVISFLITTRNGNPATVGYVTAGFWAGITLGRFLLSHPAHKVGEKLFVYVVVAGAVVFELLVWLVPNVIGNAVAVAIVGLLLGPVFPCATIIFSRAIGRKEQVSSLSVISAFGSSGGAVAPFTTGILAQAAGTFVLHPIAIGLFGVMLVCWFCIPNVKKRAE